MNNAPSTRKVRRDVRAGKRGQGHRLQELGRKVRRPDPRKIELGADDPALTHLSGLLEFEKYSRARGVHRELLERFDHLKRGPLVVYPMDAQLSLLMDMYVAGEGRVFGLEGHAQDALLIKLAGGYVPSIDVLYDDLARFGEAELRQLHQMMTRVALQRLSQQRPERVHVDIDTTVTELFGEQEGALPGPNPRYHGRPSYHPMLARVAEVQGIVGAELRPGDRGFGEQDVPTIVRWLKDVRTAVGPHCELRVRVDAAGDCTALLWELEKLGVHYTIKARISQDLAHQLFAQKRWHTVDEDAAGKPSLQVATLHFVREEWKRAGLAVRVVAARSTERDNGKQLYLWDGMEYTAQCYLTNDWCAPEQEVATLYNDRAGIEPVIGELKSAWCIGKVPSQSFDANHAAFLLKLLSYNLFRAFVDEHYPSLSRWRTRWARRVIILRPGRLCRSGRRTTLRTIPVRVPIQV